MQLWGRKATAYDTEDPSTRPGVSSPAGGGGLQAQAGEPVRNPKVVGRTVGCGRALTGSSLASGRAAAFCKRWLKWAGWVNTLRGDLCAPRETGCAHGDRLHPESAAGPAWRLSPVGATRRAGVCPGEWALSAWPHPAHLGSAVMGVRGQGDWRSRWPRPVAPGPSAVSGHPAWPSLDDPRGLLVPSLSPLCCQPPCPGRWEGRVACDGRRVGCCPHCHLLLTLRVPHGVEGP